MMNYIFKDCSTVQSSLDQYYLLYAQAVLQLSFSDQIYSGVQGPLVLASKDDVGSIEPGHLRHFVINITPVGTTKVSEVRGRK